MTIDRGAGGGLPIGFSSAELLCLAVGAALTDQVCEEAARRGIRVDSLHVDVSVDDAAPSGSGVTTSLRLEADADESVIAELVERADRTATIPNLLRLGAPVRLTDAHLIGRRGSRQLRN